MDELTEKLRAERDGLGSAARRLAARAGSRAPAARASSSGASIASPHVLARVDLAARVSFSSRTPRPS